MASIVSSHDQNAEQRDDAAAAAEPSSSPSADPFWQSTPRSEPGDLTALMAAVQQGSPFARLFNKAEEKPALAPPILPPVQRTAPVPTPKSIRQSQQPAAARRPQCTHMHMNRKYGVHHCLSCGKVPSIGWLYVCQQDRELELLSGIGDFDFFPTVPNESDYFDVQSRLAESLSMGSTVVSSIRNAEYSFEQVDTLIGQRQHLLASIREAESTSADSTPTIRINTGKSVASSESIIASVGTSASSIHPPLKLYIPYSSGIETPVHKIGRGKKHACSFQVCHPCRPFFKDRIYASFESVLSGQTPAVTEGEMLRLPMLNPSIVRNLGLRPTQQRLLTHFDSQGSVDIATQQAGGHEEDLSDWTATSATTSEADSEYSQVYPCPGPGKCEVWSAYTGCAYDRDGFDDGLRALNHGFGPEPNLLRMTPENSLSQMRRKMSDDMETPGRCSSTTSSTSLPTPTTIPFAPLTPTDLYFDDALSMRFGSAGKAATVCGGTANKQRRGRLAYKNSSSSLGSEVDVEGGVAFTEEAVGTGTPDIITYD